MSFRVLRLRNFQKHKNLKILLSPSVTTIVGRNDCGKSAVVRALKLLAFNTPAGTGYIRRTSKFARVSLTLGNGRKISRYRSSSKNLYRLDGQTFAAMGGRNVPEAVANVLNLGEVNFQQQLDPPFWFLESAGQVSKALNAVINLGVLDRTLDNSSALVRKTKSEVTFTEQRLQKAETELMPTKWVPECSMDLDKMERRFKAWQKTQATTSRLYDLLKLGNKTYQEKKTQAMASKEGAKVVEIGLCAKSLKDRCELLRELVITGDRNKKIASQAVPDLSEVLRIRGEADAVAEQRRTAETLIESLLEQDKCRLMLKKRLIKAKEELAKAEKKQRNCPVCGRPLKHSTTTTR